jgi:hypothetical protein
MLIEQQKEKYGWEFLFLGANIDAVETARNIGIAANRAANYHADSEGSDVVYKSLSRVAMNFRSAPAGENLDDYWAEEIEHDFKARGGGKKESFLSRLTRRV